MRLKIVYFSSSFFNVVFIRASLDVLTEAETMLQQECYDEAAEKNGGNCLPSPVLSMASVICDQSGGNTLYESRCSDLKVFIALDHFLSIPFHACHLTACLTHITLLIRSSWIQ